MRAALGGWKQAWVGDRRRFGIFDHASCITADEACITADEACITADEACIIADEERGMIADEERGMIADEERGIMRHHKASPGISEMLDISLSSGRATIILNNMFLLKL